MLKILTAEELKFLSRKNDFRAAMHLFVRILFHLTFSIYAIYLINENSYLLGLTLLFFHLTFMSFWGWAGIGHELFHSTVFKSRRINHILYVLSSLLTWNNYSYFSITHKAHHKRPLHDGDRESNQNIRIDLIDLVQLATFDLSSFSRKLRVLLINSLGIIPTEIESIFNLDSSKRYELIRSARIILLFHIITSILFLLTEPLFLIAFNLAPFFFTFTNRLLALAQHYGLKNEIESKGNYFLSTRTVYLGSVLSFFYANMNYHVEHHLYPGVPFYNLDKVNQILKEKKLLQHYNSGFLDVLKELYRLNLFSLPI